MNSKILISSSCEQGAKHRRSSLKFSVNFLFYFSILISEIVKAPINQLNELYLIDICPCV